MTTARVKADVVVIGGGIAGALAAIAAKRDDLDVVLVDRGYFGRTGCSALASGMFSYYRPTDDWDYWLSNHGGVLVNQELLKKAIAFQYDLANMLADWGVQWVRDPEDGGEISRIGGPGIPFPHSAMMVGGGPQFMMSVRRHAQRVGVRVINRTFAVDLLTSDGELPTSGDVVGVIGTNTRGGGWMVVEAPITVLATGPVHFPYPRPAGPFTGMPVELSGDGVAMALRAGADLGKMELGGDGLVQELFYAAQGFEMLLGLGGRLVNGRGEDFLTRYAETRALASGARRSSLGNASIVELVAGRGPILRDSRGLSAAETRLLDVVIPIIMRTFRAAGIKVEQDLVPYTRALVASTAVSGGGICTQPDGRTSLPGLYAVGNATDGAYVIMGQNLSTCAVLGYWAGEAIRETAIPGKASAGSEEQIERVIASAERYRGDRGELSFRDIHRQVEDILTEVGYVMSDESLGRALEKLGQVREQLKSARGSTWREVVKLLGLSNYCDVLDVSYNVMRHRQESRGNVLRSDFPHVDNVNWLSMTRARLGVDGALKLWDVPRPDGPAYLSVEHTRVLHPFFADVEQ